MKRHQTNLDSANKIPCKKCSGTFDSNYAMNKHVKVYHTSPANKENETSSSEDESGLSKSLQRKPTFTCTHCASFFMNRRALGNHIRDKHLSITTECPKCSLFYVGRHYCKANKHPCQNCTMKFRRSLDLVAHNLK